MKTNKPKEMNHKSKIERVSQSPLLYEGQYQDLLLVPWREKLSYK